MKVQRKKLKEEDKKIVLEVGEKSFTLSFEEYFEFIIADMPNFSPQLNYTDWVEAYMKDLILRRNIDKALD